jgi:hypothetical protein
LIFINKWYLFFVIDQKLATSHTMLGVKQAEEMLESKPLTNNARQDDRDSLAEETGIICYKLDDELAVTSRTPEQVSHKYVLLL